MTKKQKIELLEQVIASGDAILASIVCIEEHINKSTYHDLCMKYGVQELGID